MGASAGRRARGGAPAQVFAESLPTLGPEVGLGASVREVGDHLGDLARALVEDGRGGAEVVWHEEKGVLLAAEARQTGTGDATCFTPNLGLVRRNGQELWIEG